MIVKCRGSRGSIPVSGREYLKYGGDTTCLEIRTKSDEYSSSLMPAQAYEDLVII